MITGIDETGDFSAQSNKYNFFVAVHIDQNKGRHLSKQKQFEAWENSIPIEYRTQQGEVKGQLLRDEHLSDFHKQIFHKDSNIFYSAVRIIPSQNPAEILERHKAHEIKQIEDVISKAEANGHHKWADGYRKILYWYKNKNYNIMLKMKCLEHLLSVSLNHVLGWGQISYILDKEDDSNIKNISFRIDKDFVKAENTKMLWDEIFRQFWQQHSKSNPLPMLSVWNEEDHPVNKYYKLDNNNLNIRSIFRTNTEFTDSNTSWEVRIADIIGTILHRHYNLGRCSDIYSELKDHLGKDQKNYVHLIIQ